MADVKMTLDARHAAIMRPDYRVCDFRVTGAACAFGDVGVALADHRAHLRSLLQRIARGNAFHARLKHVDQIAIDAIQCNDSR